MWKVSAAPTSPDFYAIEKIQPQFDWNSGLRFNLGYIFPKSRVDLRTSFTHISTAPKNIVESESLALVGILETQQLLPFASAILAKREEMEWRLKFTEILVESGYKGLHGTHLTLRPHLGLALFKLNQELDLAYSGLVDEFGSNRGERALHKSSKLYAVGPRIGLDSRWGFTQNLGLIAAASGSLAFGRFTLTSEKTISDLTLAADPFTVTEFPQQQEKGIPILGLFFGLDWSGPVGDSAFSLSAGYETKYFWDIAINGGALSMQGLSAGATLRF